MRAVRRENLRKYLKTHRGSQARLAKELGINTSAISHFLSDDRPVPNDVVEACYKLFGIMIDDPELFEQAALSEDRQRKYQLLDASVRRLSDAKLSQVLLLALQLELSDLGSPDGSSSTS